MSEPEIYRQSSGIVPIAERSDKWVGAVLNACPLISGPASHGAADGLRHGDREERGFDGIRHRGGLGYLVPLSTEATGRGGGFQSEFLGEWWPALGSLVGDFALRAEHPQVCEHHVAFVHGANANVIKGRRTLPQLPVPHRNVIGIVLE